MLSFQPKLICLLPTMSSLPLFEGLEAYTLDKSSIQVTSEELGCGAYATVLKLKYLGLKCAGKKIHNALLLEEKETYAAKRFREECELLSQVRHPNIVQFLGVFFPNEDETVPIIVMEYLPMNLTDCIERHSKIPCEISYSILQNVALGLYYLHRYSPEPVIHRDLSSNNILLTPNMTAKISDLGVARIINISPEKASQLTKTPGTPAFMPPETMAENPEYDSSVDIFSYGAIMIHLFSGMWPEPDTQPVSIVGETMEPVSEAKRRNKHITKIGEDHPLMDVILKCIHNDPKERPTAEMIIEAVSSMTAKCPVSFDDEIDILRHIEATEAQKYAVQNTKEERLQKVEEKSRELQSHRERIEQRAKNQMVELDKVRKQLSDYQMKNVKLGNEISHLKSQITKHNSLLGNAHMLLQDAQKSITDFDEYESTEALQLNFILTFPKSPPCCPLLTSPPSSSSIAPLLPKVEKIHKEEGDHSTRHALNIIKEDDTTQISSELTVSQSNEDDESEKNLIKISPEELTLNEQIGSGHISIVWKGSLQNNTDVAISELKPGTISTADFLDQAILMHKLSNSNILKFYGVHTGHPVYIITELMTNNLLNYLQNETQVLQLSTIIHISVQVTEGMDYLHKQKCIHRNLSARNILIAENLTCKIAGFELAKIAADEVIKVETNFKFPIRWTACETFTSNLHESTFKSDVWSFGILLWEVNTFGCLPYPGMTNAQVQREVVEGYRMPCPSRNLLELYTIMLTCWRKNPMGRPTFEDLSSRLKEASPTSDPHLRKTDVESPNLGSVEESSIYDSIVAHKKEDTTNINPERAECKMALITGNYSFKCSQKQSIELTRKVEFTSHSKHYTDKSEGHGKQYADTYEGLWNKITTVLVKIYSTDSTSTQTSLQQAANIAELDHPNVIQFYAAFQTKRALYTVTEYMKTDLLTHLRYEDQSLSLSQMVSMALDIVNGMIYIEDKKFILRNLKANSIMLGENSVCKICNFDLAEAIDNSKTTYPLIMFPIRWTAPEAIFHCKFSTKSDVWSFGILLWEVVSRGSSPYPEMTLCQVREQVLQGYRMPSPSECKGELYSIMLECWNENPDNRPSFTKLREILSHYMHKVNELICDVTLDSTKTITQDENTAKSEAIGNEALLFHNEDVRKVSPSPTSATDGKEADVDITYSTGDSDLAQNHVKNPLYVAVLDYESQDDGELSFKKNELLEVEHSHSKWYWGTSKETGNEGYIPSSFVSSVPVLSFFKKINKGTYNPIWIGRWNENVPVTIKEESTTVCYTKEILEFCHPNIVHIRAVYAPSYIVMEPISQGKLNEVLQNEDKSFKLPQLITMSTQIATGMAYLEEKNCIHRHLAARNILVGDNFVCKISNFSAAKIITRSSNFTIYDMDNGICIFEDKGFTRMAIKWAAPEVMTNQKFSSKSDVWSYGILLTEIITQGNMPYPHMKNEQVLESVLKGYRMPQPKDCPEIFYNIMLDCWKADLERRPSFHSLQNQLVAYSVMIT